MSSVSQPWLDPGLVRVMCALPGLFRPFFTIAGTRDTLWHLICPPLICNNALLVPILAAYAGVVTRCIIIMVAYFFSVYPLLKKEKIVKFPNILRQLSHSIHVQVQVPCACWLWH